MPRNIPPEIKLQAVLEYLSGKGSMRSIAKEYNITYRPFRRWINKYRAEGESAFLRTGHNHTYTAELKYAVVQEFLRGEGSYEELAVKYNIPGETTIHQWVLKYNGHEKLKTSGTGGSPIMTKGRKTTFEERVEIVQYCISHTHNYSQTAERFGISYQQARSYTIKYEANGVEGLRDNRGKQKSMDEMDELERLRAEVKILKAEKERAEMEISFLKKLDEIERRRS